jgi:acetoin utilization protein AcuC
MSDGIFYYSDEFLSYDMGPQHPMKPARLKRTYDLLMSYGVPVRVEKPRPCPVSDLQAVHSTDFIWAVDRLSSGDHVPFPERYGFGTGDNPIFPEMWDAALTYCGASADAAQAIVDGRCDVSMNISGGLHHAHYDRAAGFCLFNDCVVAINRLRARFDRVAYVDIDVHHGDGVQEAFYDDPSVLTLSIHESGFFLFPGTGFVHELGARAGAGRSVNLPMWPYTNDEQWLWAWREAGLPLLKAFDPQAIVLEMGTDAHYLDPLARLCLTAQGWLEAVKDVKALGVPIVGLGGGGYNWMTVPRMWVAATNVLFDLNLPSDTPESWADHAAVPSLFDLEDPPIAPHDVDRAQAAVEEVVAEVRLRLFPYFGL